ncbi:MAG: transcriptional regulator, GntR family with aminotransferase domain [Variovorax sp.]|jgi:DNA-binding transcriptional MocR family regulator|nr:transcriptional regulator, GntR family with aminotransferase domain [Variovorax sp.]
MKRYENLVAEIEASIRDGTLRAGDQLPSVRRTADSRGVSASTVFRAYYQLEANGLIRAKDRSGYYVLGKGGRLAPPESEVASRPRDASIELAVSDHVFQVLQSSMSRKVVPLGSAFPSPLLFPLARLGQFMASSAKSLDPWSTVDDLTPGSVELRRQIALRYLADGMQVSPEEIVVTNGALEALNLCLAAVTRHGDAVIVESPTFYAALQALERMGLKAVEVATHPRDGIDLDALERAIERHAPAACWLMTTFQNPLGSLMPEPNKRRLVDVLARHRIPLIEDDVYGELYFADRRPPPAKAFDGDGMVLHCSSFSKCLAPGYRIGWASAGRFARQVAHLKLTTSLSTSAPGQHALAGYLEKGGFDKHLRKLRQGLAKQQAVFAQAVGHFFPAGTRATRPLGGYFLWIELPPGVDTLALHAEALRSGISLAPGPIFSATGGFTNCLRLNYGHEWNVASERALKTLGQLATRSP